MLPLGHASGISHMGRFGTALQGQDEVVFPSPQGPGRTLAVCWVLNTAGNSYLWVCDEKIVSWKPPREHRYLLGLNAN